MKISKLLSAQEELLVIIRILEYQLTVRQIILQILNTVKETETHKLVLNMKLMTGDEGTQVEVIGEKQGVP